MKWLPTYSLLLLSIAVIIFDQYSKFFAPEWGWEVSHNTGVSFGWGSHMTVFWQLGMMILVMGAVWWWIGTQRILDHWVWRGLFFGGAFSNVLDRIIYGGVRDWLPVPFTQLYNNVADWALAVGVMGYIASSLWKSSHDKSHQTVPQKELKHAR